MNSDTPGQRFFYGWVVVAIAFVTMAVAITARTSFSLLYPEILSEFRWSHGVTAGSYSVGFIASILLLPIVGVLMEHVGPRIVIPLGALLVFGGFVMMMSITDPVGLYIAMGILIVNGSMSMSYIVHSMFLPNWFVRNRGLAVGLAFAGVGVGAIVLLPLIQIVIETEGWRNACLYMAIAIVAVIIPINLLFQRNSPEQMGLQPNGDGPQRHGKPQAFHRREVVRNRAWVETEWTVTKAVTTVRFWAMFISMFCALFVWYGVQAHQTKLLIDEGFSAQFAAAALGFVAFFGIFGQIGIGALSDRIGRELAWTIALAGFGATSIFLIMVLKSQMIIFVYLAVIVQGLMGNGMAALFGAITTELFAGKRAASIVALIGMGGNIGAGVGAWLLGVLHDQSGSYESGLWVCWGVSILSMICIWIASPSRVRQMVRVPLATSKTS
ncbi:MAG: MFS transporter [Hyphomicrobiaceae bacterium TMED74]|nr:MFS transporter [Filomicrobium sp.]RPG42387.1 MAG: MFS transporter [Hyphomicrobiaceae bacterium TMED74]